MSLTADEAAADASLIVVAATDTSVQTVITLFRYLSVDPERTRRLQKEISSAFVGDNGEYDYQVLFTLPYLDACIQESLRIIPPGPFGECDSKLYEYLYSQTRRSSQDNRAGGSIHSG